MKTHFYNAFTRPTGEIFIESDALASYEDALQDINDFPQPWEYAYTLEVGVDGNKLLDLESEAMNMRYDEEDEHNNLVKQELA